MVYGTLCPECKRPRRHISPQTDFWFSKIAGLGAASYMKQVLRFIECAASLPCATSLRTRGPCRLPTPTAVAEPPLPVPSRALRARARSRSPARRHARQQEDTGEGLEVARHPADEFLRECEDARRARAEVFGPTMPAPLWAYEVAVTLLGCCLLLPAADL